MNQLPLLPGYPLPLGTLPIDDGINFALFSHHATAVTLCLASNGKIAEIKLDPTSNKTGDIWHILVKNPLKNFQYGYRIEGPNDHTLRYAYDPALCLLDPYAKDVSTSPLWGAYTPPEGTQQSNYRPLGWVAPVPQQPFDWQGVASPAIPLNQLVIYEMHVRGFTQHVSSQLKHPGKFLGIVEKIPYLLELGINAIELLPLQEFNEHEVKLINPATCQHLCNFWGYSTVNYFTPMHRYAVANSPGAAMDEFKTMVRELHRNGIEVFLDMVFNHTAEGNEEGPILSFKGIDNPIYYLQKDDGDYSNFSGCGNTFSCNHPVGWELILESLRYWTLEGHVDGFRFDLAAILSRGRHGELLDPAPLLDAITRDPVLAKVKLIAEPWDAVGMYLVGKFGQGSQRWSEWNDKYRDAVRWFMRGTPGNKGEFTTRLCGSEDLYYDRSPLASLNYITAHDGFSLHDLVSYNMKHNMENGENNRDGAYENYSWNCGIEGKTDDLDVLQLRQRQMRNLYVALLISQGIPMLCMGDEYGQTKDGNNNTWCHDNELNWFLWNKLEVKANQSFWRFCRNLIRFRKNNSLLQRETFLTDEDVQWHGIEPFKPEWHDNNQFIGFTLIDHDERHDIYAAFNACGEAAKVIVPEPPQGKRWHIIVNTSADAHQDTYEEDIAPAMDMLEHVFIPYSALLLKAL